MSNEIITGRNIAEITADIRLNFRTAATCIAAIGRDLIEAKGMLQHGEWLPWLRELGINASTADNYMRYAREIPDDGWMAALPYSKAMALLRLPEDQREEFREKNNLEDTSAAEIKRLVAQIRMQEKAVSESTLRAEKAEKLAEELRNQPREKEIVEVEPADYRQLRENVSSLQAQLQEAEDAASSAEEREGDARREAERLRLQLEEAEDAALSAEEQAAKARSEAERLKMQMAENDTVDLCGSAGLGLDDYVSVCNEFKARVWSMPFMGDLFREAREEDLRSYRIMTEGIRSWAQSVLDVIETATAPIVVEEVR